ncbi:TPA: tail fiber assembly protein [Klebsiella pneumoniae]
MANYALIKKDLVDNIIVWDGNGTLFPDYTVIKIEDVMVGVGWSFLDGKFIPPPESQKTHEELVAIAENKKNSLLSAATTVMAPLQDAVELGIATDDEIFKLNELRKYRVLINRVNTSVTTDIVWPDFPL